MKTFLITSIVISYLDTVNIFGVIAGTNEIPSNTQGYPRVNGTEIEGVVAQLQPVINNEGIDGWIARNNVEEIKVEAFGRIEEYLSDRYQQPSVRWFIYIK